MNWTLCVAGLIRPKELDIMDLRNFTFMFYGFSVAWTILAIYAVSLMQRQSKINKQVESLKKMVEGKRL